MAQDHSLYIVRHAVAAERGPEYPDDTQRPLTEEGISKFRKVVGGLVALEVEVDVILTSPLTRAAQTADLLSKGLDHHPNVVVTGALSPDAPYKTLLAELKKHSRKKAVALVGHEPHLGDAAARLLGWSGRFDFRKGGICRIDVEQMPPTTPGHLQWFAPPKLLIRVRSPR